jgi:hypothetical protein
MITSTEKPMIDLPEQPPRQRSYLLRCMETRSQMLGQSEPCSSWRFSLQDTKTDAVHNFQNLESLMTFMQEVLDEESSD